MRHLAISTPPASTLPAQAITGFVHAEVMTDVDTGKPAFCLATDQSLGDFTQADTLDEVLKATATERARLNRIERLATEFFQAAATHEPRSWTVADSSTGMPLNGTCMAGCDGFHLELSSGTAANAEDVLCTQYDRANTTELQIGCGADNFGDWATLSVEIKSHPVHPDEAMRIPHAAVEVTEDHYIEDLDGNGLAVVIDKLEKRVAAMRVRHAELVRIRSEYLGRQA